MSVHEPLSRKRPLEELGLGNGTVSKKVRPVDAGATTPIASDGTDISNSFSESMYSAYVKSALESLEKVCFTLDSFP